MKRNNKYYKANTFLEGLSNLSTNPEIYLKRMRYFLDLIGNPDRNLKFIHITGTAGKGTVTSMVHEILFASGKKVGSFTSPFVTVSTEKIKIDDKYISCQEFSDIVEFLKPYIFEVNKKCLYGSMSYFEIFFAIALIYFKRKKCKWVVLEVGIGGRYDATNVIEKPVITAITNIDYDHTEILGNTLQKIAYDKAGIIKNGSIFFTTEHRLSLIKVFKKICHDKQVLMTRLSHQKDYQEYNRNLAIAITKSLGIKNVFIETGLKRFKLQCRFEMIQNNPIVIIDGAHNRVKMKSTIYNLKKLKFRKLYLIIAISKNKDHISILKQIAPYADYFFATEFKNKFRKCIEPKDLINKARKFFKTGVKIKIFSDADKALFIAIKNAKKDDLILVTGSFFLAGEIRKHWISEEWILKNRKSFK